MAQAVGRTLPHSLEAEEYLLSCCLLDGAEIIAKCVVAKITPASFYDTKHSIIYEVLIELFNDKKPIDISTLAEELKTRKHLDQVGGYAFLTQVSSRIPTTAQASFFIEKVRELALLRDIIRSGTGIVEDCYNYTGDMPEFISSSQRKFLNAITSHTIEETKTLKKICDDIRVEAEALRSGKIRGDENDLSWGLAEADKFLKPFRRGELVCLAARPGVGKSSLMRQVVVRNVIRDSKNVCVFTLEVTTEEFIKNCAQALSGVNPREINKYPNDEQETFVKWVDRIGLFDKTLHVHDVNASLANIVANVRIHHSKQPVDMVVIDYLQLINERSLPGENRDQLLGRITRALKLLANELQCVVIILSQLNRSVEREDRPPHLADLRESGNIEQDCDRVVFIYRPKTKPDGSTQDFDDDTVRFLYCELLQRKGRNVGEHSLGLQFQRDAARFLPVASVGQS